MKITVIGSHSCPETLGVLQTFYQAGISVDFKDILSGHDALRDYLELRDRNAAYTDIRGTGRLGIPAFILEDGTVTLDLSDVVCLIKNK